MVGHTTGLRPCECSPRYIVCFVGTAGHIALLSALPGAWCAQRQPSCSHDRSAGSIRWSPVLFPVTIETFVWCSVALLQHSQQVCLGLCNVHSNSSSCSPFCQVPAVSVQHLNSCQQADLAVHAIHHKVAESDLYMPLCLSINRCNLHSGVGSQMCFTQTSWLVIRSHASP